ncbi:MAG: aminotransferase class I/II-fold pyridoxal phosphate-dependent enzyme [Propionibacteriales bacterium]|nr:aminotransferase class I/II-fold pyridoxal phosphate-dependent enzyme [Propionibacteriales bacterium]
MKRIYLSAPDVGEGEEQALVRAIRSGWVAPLGPEVDAFEAALAEVSGRAHCAALSSGTAAIHLGLLALGVGAGDVVVTSSMTFAATANAIVYTGAQPYFVDSDASGNMDPDLLADTLGKLDAQGITPAAVVPVDLLGKVVDHDRIDALAAARGIPVLSDAAEALGASRGGRPAGSFGAFAALSFNGNKIMTTSGGGALLTDDGDQAARVRYLATQARQPAVHYEHTEVGYNYRMSNLLAALGRAQLERLDAMIGRRKVIRQAYRELFADVAGVEIFGGVDDSEDNNWLTAILVDPTVAGWQASDLGAALTAADIESRPLWKPMHLQPVFAGAPATVNGTSQRLFETGLSLPSGSALSESELDRVHSEIRTFLRARP